MIPGNQTKHACPIRVQDLQTSRIDPGVADGITFCQAKHRTADIQGEGIIPPIEHT